MANRISVVLDFVTDKAVGSVNNFKKALNDAETNGTSKFKAGANQAFDSVKNNAGALALSAGTSLVAFGVHAVGAFTGAAKAALDFGTATGLAVEDASRWIAVGDDFGITAEQLTAGVGKIAKSLDDTKWAKYGIETRTAGGAARETNDILIDAFARLGEIENATERARVGNELFGKGYSNLAPLIGKTADEYKTMLGAVEDGQVITAKEAEKAEKMRLAQDALADALNEVTLAVGGAVAELGPYIEGMANAAGAVTGFIDKVEGLETALAIGSGNPLIAWSSIQSAARTEVDLHGMSLERLTEVLNDLGATEEQAADITAQWREANGLAAGAVDGVGAATEVTGPKVDKYAQAHRDAAGAAADAKAADEEYRDAIDRMRDATDKGREAVEDRIQAEKDLRDLLNGGIKDRYQYMQDARDAADALDEYNKKLGEGELSARDVASATEDLRLKFVDVAEGYAGVSGAAQGTKEWNDKVIESLYNQAIALAPDSPVRQAILGYIGDLQGVEEDITTDLVAVVDEAGLAAAEAIIANAARPRNVPLIVNGQVVGTSIGGGIQVRHGGGPVRAGVPYVVGDNPDGSWNSTTEVVVPSSSGTVIPNRNLPRNGLSGSTNLTLNMTTGATTADVFRAVDLFWRLYGRAA